MNNIIDDLKKITNENGVEVSLNNNRLTTHIKCFSKLCAEKIIEFSKAFNFFYKEEKNEENHLTAYIYENDDVFQKALEKLEDPDLTQTEAVKSFNQATITTSIAKCTNDKKYYILRCYDYFIYIFDKENRNCYMIVKQNKKAITMVNILLLTPYLMYGELYAVHGGLVNKDDMNVLINNSSLGGKTTFAILFATHGWNIITEETTYITKKGNVLPYNIRNYFNIRVGTYLAFKDYFLKRNIINETFLSMEGKTENELFEYGKNSQFSIDFDDIGTNVELENMRISHSLKVSIGKEQDINIKKCSPLENVNSFLELSLAPTVLLFKELLDYENINKEERYKELVSIFKNTKSFILKSGFNYKENYEYILNQINS